MKHLILVRHATALDTGPEGSDFHRKLRKRGRREAAIMADRTAGPVGCPDHLVTSPADRARETAEIFADRVGYPRKRVEVREELYGGLLPEEFLRIVQSFGASHGSVMVFGHDPSFSEFAAYLAPAFSDPIPKAGVVVIGLDARSWSQVGPGTGKVVLFDQPPEPEEQKQLEEDLLTKLRSAVAEGILEALSKFDVAASPAVLRTVAGTSERLAKALRPYAGAGEPAPAPAAARPGRKAGKAGKAGKAKPARPTRRSRP